ncbi:DUF6777 domain-containing protein [Streptomyces coeruleoprunus]|uniref:DUF6777 domain-containing protein n=1 Tax=Streptomyces coeruleoprunus TaxID=285563 RepID=A0ABV9XK92_9ACTN
MRSPTRRPTGHRHRHGLLALAAAGGLLAVAACGQDGDRSAPAAPAGPAGEILLQPAAAQGPHPFTASTVLTSDIAPGDRPSAGPRGVPGPGAGPAEHLLRTVDGATPGLYGGTQSLASCDVPQQVGFLTADRAKERAFAQAAGINPADLAGWMGDLTPVMLRADTRVTGHGYRDGAAVPFQAVLQAGTAVLVDRYGAPRVRCACGNPLRSPVTGVGAAVHKGKPWPGFRADRVVAVNATQRTLDSLIIVNVLNNTWLERTTGTGGERDRSPEVPPAYDPGERHVADTPVPDTGRTDGDHVDAGRPTGVPGVPTGPDGPRPPRSDAHRPPAPPQAVPPPPQPYVPEPDVPQPPAPEPVEPEQVAPEPVGPDQAAPEPDVPMPDGGGFGEPPPEPDGFTG